MITKCSSVCMTTRTESNDPTRESASAGEVSSEVETQKANGAESLEDLGECENAGRKKNVPSTSIVPTEDSDVDGLILPSEIVIEILCRLPLISLAKIQLVCKEWRGFIYGRYLMERNMERRKVTCHWHNSVEPSDQAKPDDSGENIVLLDGRDGLLLVMSVQTMKFTIWNPATFGVFRLPDPHKDAIGVTFSYVKSTGNYLVVSVYKDESGRESCQVITPGQSESWRPLAFPDVAEAEGRRERQLVRVVPAGGAVHTVLILKVGSTVTRKVVSLDLETECFTVTCFTQTKFNNLKSLWAINWDGKLALMTLVGDNLHVMELEDYKKRRWCRQNKVIPLPFLRARIDYVSSLVPLFARDGEIWFKFGESSVVIHTIETGFCTYMNSIVLSPAAKLYPYKPTLVGFQGMQQDAGFGKRWTLNLR